jgi:hypothetical protein
MGVRFSRIAEQKSAELADSLVRKLMESPRTEAYREIDAAALREEFRACFIDLTDWLLERTTAEIEEKFLQMGKTRASQGVPLSHSVNAMITCRDHLLQYLRQESKGEDGVELFGELEFASAVGHFFDDAIFFVMWGYRVHQLGEEEVA